MSKEVMPEARRFSKSARGEVPATVLTSLISNGSSVPKSARSGDSQTSSWEVGICL